jgi:hypothetical protein
MDLDALHRNVARLMKFMERVENQKVVADQDAPPLNDAKVHELEERVRAFGERLDQAGLPNLADRIGALETYKSQIVEPALKDISDIMPKLQGVGDMLDWFQQNRAMLEGAIAMADAFDGPDAPEQANDGLPAASGASSEVPAPEAPAAADGSQAASDKPAGT